MKLEYTYTRVRFNVYTMNVDYGRPLVQVSSLVGVLLTVLGKRISNRRFKKS